MSYSKELIAVVDGFAEAAIDSSRWNDALRKFASLTGSSYGQLIGIGGPRNIPFNFMSVPSEKLTDEFIEIDGGSPLINPRIAASDSAAPLQIVTEEDFDALRPQLISDDYLDFASKHDIPFGCQTALAKDEEGVIGLAVLRAQKEGRTTAEQLQAFMSVAPFVRMATQMQVRLQGEGALLIAGAFEAMSISAFICDGNARVQARTAGGNALLSSGWLKVSSGRLALGNGIRSASLPAAIARCEKGGQLGLPKIESLVLKSMKTSASLVLDVAPIAKRFGSMRRSRQVLIMARQSALSNNNRLAILIAAFDFTPTEAEIAAAVLDGMSRRQIAASRNVSEATVQTQLKAIFMKAGIRREGELVAVLSRTLGR